MFSGAFRLAGAFALLALAGCASPDFNRPLVASGHPDWPPVMFREGDAIDGVGPALEQKIFSDLGIPAKFVYAGQWDEVQGKGRSGDVDVLVAAYKTKAREEYFVYSIPYIMDPLVIFVKPGHEFPFTKNADLIGKKGIGTVGDSYGQEFDDYLPAHLTFTRTDTAKEALDMVENGSADYFIYSLYSGREELKTNHREGDFVTLPHVVAEEPFYLAMSRQSPFVKYLPNINALIQKYHDDGTIDALTRQYKAQFHLDQ